MEVLRTAWRPLLLCIGANTLGIAGVYFTNTFMIAYTTQQLGLPRSLILECLFVVAIIQFCIPTAGGVGRREDRRDALPVPGVAAGHGLALPDVRVGRARPRRR